MHETLVREVRFKTSKRENGVLATQMLLQYGKVGVLICC
jgi:hypothetical protein